MKNNLTLFMLFFLCLSNAFAQNWIQQGTDIDGEATSDYSGTSVSMSSDGNSVAVGAFRNSGNGSAAGHVRVYSWNGSVYTQKGADIDGEAAGDEFGWRVRMSSDGNTLAIGALNNSGNGQYAGHVRVYAWSGTTWTQKGTDIDGEAADDWSGYSVCLSSDGNTVAIGAPWNSGNGENAGHVRVYSWSGTNWTQKGLDIQGEAAGDYSGYSVSMSSDGNSVAIGAIANNTKGYEAGHVRVYTWNGAEWVQKGSDIDAEAAVDWSGYSVSMSSDGNTLAVGAPNNSGNGTEAGHVRVYAWSGKTWTQKGLDIDGEAAGDHSGTSVSISSDGNTVAVGATGNDGNGTDAGHVRVYSWSDAWTQIGSDIDGEAAGDYSGSSVSVSSNGIPLAIGAPWNDGTGTDAGQVRVFRYGISSGIIHNTMSSLARIYPNPSSNIFTLNLGQTHQKIELKITDLLGQIILTKRVESASEVEFEIAGDKGVYLVEIRIHESHLTTLKVIKE